MSRGWVAVHRKIVDWEWYQDANTFRLFMHLLFKANYSFGKWRGESLSPGQLVTGREQLASDLRISEQSIRTALGHLKSTGVITIKSTNKYSIISIVNWDSYQPSAASFNQQAIQPVGQQLANNQPSTNHIQQSKKGKKGRRKNEEGETPSDGCKSSDLIAEQARAVLEHLNKVTGKRFKVTGLIPARLRAGAAVEECMQVIDYKAKDEGFDRKYLDHTTPFREANFDKYLNQALADQRPNKQGRSNEDDDARGWSPEPENKWARGVGSPHPS
ncbi:conserved phage C-terminal domain-containing protein [Pseudodesulfovibrio methanolicus]|uniref:Conserved phage C-terminal domain-containing protein n=1 Tax=Pseudodesulfovibrio methanolicus TaxID=3126690 RepID=A0ABZ2J5F1_9BACT